MKFRSPPPLNSPGPSPDVREAQRQESTCDASSDPVRRVQNNEMIGLVEQAFAALPQEQRTVVILKEYHALRFSEIAEIMQRPIGTVKSLNHRGRASLMESLAKYVD